MKPFLIVLLTLCGQEPVEKEAGAPDPLALYNLKFRADYAKTRARLLAEAGPVIVVGGASMTLYDQGEKKESPTINDRYSRLKALSHIPLHVYVLLASEKEAPLVDSVKERLIAMRGQWAALPQALPPLGLKGESLERNVRMIERTLKQTEAWAAGSPFDAKSLNAYCLAERGTIEANLLEAAQAQIDTMDATIQTWRKALGPRWEKVNVVVRGMQMPRKDNLAVSYFAKLLGEKGECDRIVYAEGMSDDAAALSLLGTRILDTDVGTIFFQDRWRMHRDILGDAAKQVLTKEPKTP